MARIAVLHPDLSSFGGGEVVCLHVLKSIDMEHDVDVVTATPDFDLQKLASFVGTDPPNVSVRDAGHLARSVHRFRGDRFSLAEVSTFTRSVKSICTKYDMVISTINEVPISGPAIQYIHVPQFNRPQVPGQTDVDTFTYNLYRRACRMIAGGNSRDITDSVLLANSQWTAKVTEKIYGSSPSVLYPPIDVRSFLPKPWVDREPGFVSVGRLEPEKNVLNLIQVIDRIRDHGFDTHLHIVGPQGSSGYGEQVTRVAAERSYVSYEGTVERNELINLLETHRFGLHGRKYEHFGMAVAEMVTAGMIPLVPDSGGQVEIVGGADLSTYSSTSEAVRNGCKLLSGDADIDSLRASFVNPSSDLSIERFRDTISTVVTEQIDSTGHGACD